MTAFRQASLLCPGDQVDLLEEILFLCEAQAVTLLDEGDSPIFEPPVGTHPVWPLTRVQALFYDERSNEEILATLALYTQRAELVIELPNHLAEIADEDWVRVSLEQFQPLRIGRFWVRPSWRDDPIPEDHTLLTLDPGLAFGTGMHPTTQLCLEWLSDNVPRGQSVMDFGCGSGILAVAAGCLGAAHLTGLDIDPQALIATESNAALNDLSIDTRMPDQLPSEPFDLVLANILANPLMELAPTISALLKPGGTLLLAGLLENQAASVQSSYPEIDFGPSVTREGWARLAGVRRKI